MDIANQLRKAIGSALKELGYRKEGGGGWIRQINQDISLIADFGIVNNAADKFVFAQISIGSEYLQRLHDPSNSIGMRLSYLTVSVGESLNHEGHLPYPSSEEEAKALATAVVGALSSINGRLEVIGDGGQALQFIQDHPRFGMVGKDVLSYLNDLHTGKITHKKFPNWQSYATARSE